jgi:hypothetical protein
MSACRECGSKYFCSCGEPEPCEECENQESRISELEVALEIAVSALDAIHPFEKTKQVVSIDGYTKIQWSLDIIDIKEHALAKIREVMK